MKKEKINYMNLGVQIAEMVKSTLGPKGMNKMVLQGGEAILTNDGATIIQQTNWNNPIGDMFKKLAASQEKASGDGTTTATIFAGQLLEKGVELLNKNVHPTTIISGYTMAKALAIQFIDAQGQEPNRQEIIKTTFGSKIEPELVDHFTELILGLDLDNLRIFKRDNSDPYSSMIIKGYAFPGFTVNDRMQREFSGKIAVLDTKSQIDTSAVQVNSADELKKVQQMAKDHYKKIVDFLVEKKVGCVFFSDTNPELESYLTEKKIMSIVNYQREHIDGVCRACNAIAISDPEDLDENKFGEGIVRFEKDPNTIFVESKDSKLETLVIAAGTEQVLLETERAIDDVIGVLKHLKKAVVGAGAIEIQTILHLEEIAAKVGGKEQVAIRKFAEALEMIPLVLAENCGLDSIDILTKLKTLHLSGNKVVGVDPANGISDAQVRGVMEPAEMKIHAIASATDVANLILKLDDIVQGDDGNEKK